MKTPQNKRSSGIWISSFIAIAFGLLTLKEGGLTLFGPPQYTEAAGQYVPFVLWFNFIAGFFYILAGVYIFRQHRVAAILSMLIALLTVGVFGAFAVHIALDGAYEQHTLIAMLVRSLVWIGIAIFVCRKLMIRTDEIIHG
ncbi:MAG: hypothetical protein L3K24_14580 [Gammaproteobacteria bacterium]|nr:hypothetical protein [Gammaproteobacteria bacterium]